MADAILDFISTSGITFPFLPFVTAVVPPPTDDIVGGAVSGTCVPDVQLWSVVEDPSFPSMDETTLFYDVAPGDVTTKEYSSATAGGDLVRNLYFVAMLDFGTIVNLGAWAANYLTDISFAPSSELTAAAWLLEKADSEAGGFTTVGSGDIEGPTTATETISGNLFGAALRYLRLTLHLDMDDGATFAEIDVSDFRANCAAPATPTGLAGLGVCEGAQVTLVWDAASGATGYRVVVTAPGGVGTFDVGDVTTWVYAPATIGVEYEFQVIAYNDAADSVASEAIAVTPCSTTPDIPLDTPDAPQTVAACEGAQATIWATPVSGAESYQLYRYDGLTPSGTLVYSGDLPTELVPFVDAPLLLGISYSYRVRALSSGAVSALSAATTITPCVTEVEDDTCCTDDWTVEECG